MTAKTWTKEGSDFVYHIAEDEVGLAEGVESFDIFEASRFKDEARNAVKGREPMYEATPKHPIREMLKALTGVQPPAFVKGYDTRGLSDAEATELQDWAASNVKPSWATGIGLIEGAERMVAEAVSNGNIPPAPKQRKKS